MDLAVDLSETDAPQDARTRPQFREAAEPRNVAIPFQRGPMRPGALASARRRLSGKTLARQFRLIDTLALWALAVAAVAGGSSSAMFDLPVSQALPPVSGALLTLSSLTVMAAYEFRARESLATHLFKVAAAGLVGIAAALIAAGLLRHGFGAASRWILFGSVGLGGVHAIEWGLIQRWRAMGRLTPNVIVVGATANAGRLIETALNAGDAAILGVFDDRMSRIPSQVHGVPVLGDTKALLTHKLLPYVDRIVITVTPSAQTRVRELIDRLKFLPNAVTLFMDVEGAQAQRSALSQMADAPLTQVSGVREDDARADAKRAQDLALGTLALVLAAPVMLLIALAVRLDSPGPIFFRQRRHGFNNEAIDVWKFRSMRHEAADAKAERQVSVNDRRVTPVGRIIRRLSLDELPQLINVLKGEMSLVGPRPHAIGMKTAGEDSARLVAEYAWRHRMKPGLTGWAQVNGSIGAVDTPDLVRRRVTLDVDYIARQSFWFDLYILLMTLPALVSARNTVR